MAEETGEGGRSFRVLVVDDNKDAADTLCILARLWGYDVRAVYDGAEALNVARAYRPECLFLDIGLPGLDGYDLARRVRREPALAGAKLVALTAYSGPEHERRAREAGFDYHLVKPADPAAVEELLQMVSQVLKLASRTEALAQQSVELARETRDLIGGTKEDLREVRHEIREVKEELKEVKEELKEVKEVIKDRAEGDPGQA
jgi:CheY-like chemotaxis protein